VGGVVALTTRRARRDIKSADPDRREAVRQELEAVAASQITDVLTWETDAAGNVTRVTVVPSERLSERARRAIKKVKVVPGELGATIEIEMHDKLSALRVLARSEGLLDGNDDDKRPSLVGINLRGPKELEEGGKDAEGQAEG